MGKSAGLAMQIQLYDSMLPSDQVTAFATLGSLGWLTSKWHRGSGAKKTCGGFLTLRWWFLHVACCYLRRCHLSHWEANADGKTLWQINFVCILVGIARICGAMAKVHGKGGSQTDCMEHEGLPCCQASICFFQNFSGMCQNLDTKLTKQDPVLAKWDTMRQC